MTGKKPGPTTAVDAWNALRQKINSAARRPGQIPAPSPREQEALLKKRAEKLAQIEKKADTTETLEVVEFRLAEEHYGLEYNYVREVYPLKSLTPIPGTPDFILGIVSIRGEILSVVDLKRFFEMPLKGLTDLTRVIILYHRETGMTFGILAEEVLGTLSVPVRDIQPPPPTLTGIRADYLHGVAKQRLIVLDAAKLLTDKRMIVHQEVEG
jgi:purine-binding chemotaxis protein CheW